MFAKEKIEECSRLEVEIFFWTRSSIFLSWRPILAKVNQLPSFGAPESVSLYHLQGVCVLHEFALRSCVLVY